MTQRVTCFSFNTLFFVAIDCNGHANRARSTSSSILSLSLLPFRFRPHLQPTSPVPRNGYIYVRTHTIHHRQRKTTPLEFISRRSRGCSIAPFRGTCGPTSQSRSRVGKVPLSTSAPMWPSMSMFTIALYMEHDHLRDGAV